jgi:hypothetical protein
MIMRKFGKELGRIGHQAGRVIEHAATQVDAAVFRAQLDDERDRASIALTSAEKAATEIQQLVTNIQGVFAAKTIPKPTPEEATQLSEAVSAQFQLADDKFATAKKLQQALETAQQTIQTQLQLVRDKRGILSPSNNEPIPDNPLQAGRAACAAAEQSASNIQTILTQARLDAENCKVALTEYHSLMTGGNPKAVSQFFLQQNQALSKQLLATQAELEKLKLAQQSASTSSAASGEKRSMLPQQSMAVVFPTIPAVGNADDLKHRRSLSTEYS